MINDKITDVAMKLVMQNNTLLHIQSCNRNNEWLEYNNKETIYIHYNGNEYFLKKLRFTPHKAEQLLQGMELQEKEAQKD